MVERGDCSVYSQRCYWCTSPSDEEVVAAWLTILEDVESETRRTAIATQIALTLPEPPEPSDTGFPTYSAALPIYTFGEYAVAAPTLGPGRRLIQAIRGISAGFLGIASYARLRGVPASSTWSALGRAKGVTTIAAYFMFESAMLFDSALSGEPYTPRLATLVHGFLAPIEYAAARAMSDPEGFE